MTNEKHLSRTTHGYSAGRQILDLTFRPEVKFLRAKWELVRWGRVAPTPMFVLGFRLEEIPVFTRASAS